MVYWFSERPPLHWLDTFGCQVAGDRHLSKLLGMPFGIAQDVADVDEFLYQKIEKKLQYWSTLYVSLPTRTTLPTPFSFPPYGTSYIYGQVSTR